MGNMVERVAVALSMADPDERGLPDGVEMAAFYRTLARAAIEAMREPTEEMVNTPSEGRSKDRQVASWQAWVDAALKEPAKAKTAPDDE